nr:hypothetical protein [Tanacetum cinerariifolium]
MAGKGKSLSDSASCEDVYGERPNSSYIPVDEALSKEREGGGGLDDCVDPLLVSNDDSKLTMADVEHGKVESVRKANKDKVQFGASIFYKSSNAWSSNTSGVEVKANGAMNTESFAEKMKKGVEDRELQMKFDSQAVST